MGSEVGPATAKDWLVFYFGSSFVHFLPFGLVIGNPGTALKALSALMALGIAFIEINIMLTRRESKDLARAMARDTRKIAAVVCAAVFAAYVVQASALPDVQLGVGQVIIIYLVALAALGIYNNRKPRC